MKRFLIGMVMLGLVGVVVWAAHRRIKESAAAGAGRGRQRGAVAVETTAVRRGALTDVRVLTGTLRADAHIVIAPKVAGRLETLAVDLGDTVRHGQALATLESEEYAQRVEQARAELEVVRAGTEQARNALDVARREYERAEALREKQIASESELDVARSRFDTADANLKVALAQTSQKEAALRSAEIQLSYTRIAAVWEDGEGSRPRVVGERFADQGAMLKANDPIVSLVSLDPIRAVVQVTEAEYTLMQPGRSATLTCDAFPDRVFPGTITRVAPLLREATRKARVEVDVPNPDHLLRPGMFVRVRVELAQRDDTVIVPSYALVRRDEQQGVFMVVPGETTTVRFVPLRLGIRNGTNAEVLDPPDLAGDLVVLGQHLLQRSEEHTSELQHRIRSLMPSSA